MNSSQIHSALSKDEKVRNLWVGAFAADKLPTKEYPGAYIANTEPAGRAGEHWLAFFTPEFGKLEAFDSYGRHPSHYSNFISEWMGNDECQYNTTSYQNYNTTVCGQYCMLFVALRCREFSFADIINILNLYKGRTDEFVCKFINKNFNLKTSVQDFNFLRQWMQKK